MLVAVGAAVLLISLFFDWFGVGAPNGGAVTAWTAFELLDVVLALLAIAVICAVLAQALPQAGRLPALAGSPVAELAGPVALVLIVVSMLNEPPLLQAVAPEIELEVGIWLALTGAALMTIGSLLTRMQISLVMNPREQGPRTGSAPPADPAAETQPMPASPDRPGAGPRTP